MIKNLKKLLTGTVIVGLGSAYLIVKMGSMEDLLKIIITGVFYISIGGLLVAGILKKAKKL